MESLGTNSCFSFLSSRCAEICPRAGKDICSGQRNRIPRLRIAGRSPAATVNAGETLLPHGRNREARFPCKRSGNGAKLCFCKRRAETRSENAGRKRGTKLSADNLLTPCPKKRSAIPRRRNAGQSRFFCTAAGFSRTVWRTLPMAKPSLGTSAVTTVPAAT